MTWEPVLDWTKSKQPDPNVFVYAAGFLLAGGQSSRMGQDKAFLRLGGETLAERGLRKLREVCPDVAIAGGVPELSRFGRVIPDLQPCCGPLVGIVSALEQSQHEWNLFLAVDMPFVPLAQLRMLLSLWAGGRTLVSVPEVNDRVHPLCGVYSRQALPIFRAELTAGRYRLTDAIKATRAYGYVPWLNESWVVNLNTPEEFRAAERSVHG